MWCDKETMEDCLGFSVYTETLSELALERDLAPLTIGIFGDWGSGKTSLMCMIQKYIDYKYKEKVKTIWFNAWQYEGKDEIQSALIHSLLHKLKESQTLSQELQGVYDKLKEKADVFKLAKFITKTALTLTPDFNGFLDCFKQESDKLTDTMESFNKDFQDFLAKLNIERIVVFIDDLDRCLPDRVVEIFEIVKLFLNSPQSTFVIGADIEKIEYAIGEKYKEGTKEKSRVVRDYLEKIIQLPFSIPEQRPEDITSYVNMLILGKYLMPEGWQALLGIRPQLIGKSQDISSSFFDWASAQETKIIPDKKGALEELKVIKPYVALLIRGLKGNPRQVKRFLNILELRRRIAATKKIDVKHDLLIKLLVIEYTWQDFFKNLVDTYDPTTGTSELLREIIEIQKSQGKKKIEDSDVLKAAFDTPGLIKFVLDAPQIDTDLDLSPYLLLAQTALIPKKLPAYTTSEEEVRNISNVIAGVDKIRAVAAAKQAIKLPPEIVEGIVRKLQGELITNEDPRVPVHIMLGLKEICRNYTNLYSIVIESLRQVDPTKNEALAMIANDFLKEAGQAGISGIDDLQKKFEESSPIISALKQKR